MRSFRVLVVEDFELFRRFVCSTLEPKTEFQVIGEASDGLEAVQKAEELQPDLILLDIGLPTLNGIEAAKRIRQLAPQAKILFLSQESSPEVVQEAIRLGALGYVEKSRAQSELLPAIDAVLRGVLFVSSGLRVQTGIRSRQSTRFCVLPANLRVAFLQAAPYKAVLSQRDFLNHGSLTCRPPSTVF